MNYIAELQKIASDFKVNTYYWKNNRLKPYENYFRNYPAPWIKKTIELLKFINGKTVVEIGSTRISLVQDCINYFDNSLSMESKDAPPCCQDGHSTFFWAREGFDVYTVDIDSNCKTAIENQYIHHLRQQIPNNIYLEIPKDGIQFLKDFNKPIDLLYLDGWDVGSPNYAENHLECYFAAKDKLADIHLISVDDTDFNTVEGGKDKLLTPYLLGNGYIRLIWGRQIVFTKSNL